MRHHYLRILRRLLNLRRRYVSELSDEGLYLIDRCIAAAFRECVDAGADPEARALLSQLARADS